MNLLYHKTKYEAFCATKPGAHARAIGEVLYHHSQEIGPANAGAMRDAQHYLETLAWKEVEASLPDWLVVKP